MQNDGVKLLPCPLCNVELFHNGVTELGDIYEHPTNGCAIQVAWFTATPEWVAKWNRRAIPSTVSGETGWQDIASAPKDRTEVLIAVPTKDRTGYHVGEAYFDPENYEGGDWWWAGTGWGDYHGGPISEINHWPPTHWQPLPPSPANPAETQAVEVGK